MATVQHESGAAALRARWEEYRAQNKRAFKYDAAEAFGVSEAELVAADCGNTLTRLQADWKAFLLELQPLGRVMTITRNHDIVHEKKGYYGPVSYQGHIGLVLDEGIDLRLFMNAWKIGFAVANPDNKNYPKSFQFFDGAGRPIHKIFVGPEGLAAFDALVEKYRSDDQSQEQAVTPANAAPELKPDSEIDVEGMRTFWRGLQDTHDFYPMLKKFNVGRLQAMRLAGPEFAERLKIDAFEVAVKAAAERKMPIMVFVGNPGCIQIHTGPAEKIFEIEDWFNIMDPEFNLHMRRSGVAEAWLTKKPTRDGMVTAVELYDADGKDIALLFGKRKPGIPELPEWRELAEGLERF